MTHSYSLDLQSFVMKHADCRCTFSIGLISCWMHGSHTTDPYSNFDLTSDMYANFQHSRGQFFRLRRINPKVEFASLLILFMCVFHVRSSNIVYPKYGFEDTC